MKKASPYILDRITYEIKCMRDSKSYFKKILYLQFNLFLGVSFSISFDGFKDIRNDNSIIKHSD